MIVASSSLPSGGERGREGEKKREEPRDPPTILRVPATPGDKGRLSETLSDQVVFSLYGSGRRGGGKEGTEGRGIKVSGRTRAEGILRGREGTPESVRARFRR